MASRSQLGRKRVSHWSALLTREQIEAQRAVTAKLDPTFAKLDAEFWDA